MLNVLDLLADRVHNFSLNLAQNLGLLILRIQLMLLHLVLKYLLENVFDSDILVSLRILFALRNLKYRRAKLLKCVILEVFLNL